MKSKDGVKIKGILTMHKTQANTACTGRGFAPRLAARFANFRAIISVSFACPARR